MITEIKSEIVRKTEEKLNDSEFAMNLPAMRVREVVVDCVKCGELSEAKDTLINQSQF